ARQRGDIGHEPRLLLGLAVLVDPLVDAVDVLETEGPQEQEDAALTEHVLVEDGRALRDHRDPDAALAAPAHDILSRAKHPLLAFHWSLRRDRVGLIDLQYHRRPVFLAVLQPIERLHESGHEGHDLILSKVRQIQEHADALLDDELGDELTAARLQRDIAMAAPEDNDRQARTLP